MEPISMATPIDRPRRNWRKAFSSMGQLLGNPDNTHAVFEIMQALNAGNAVRNYERLIGTVEGGQLAYERVELVEKLTNREWRAQFAPGTVGAAYRNFIESTGYSADGLVEISNDVHGARKIEHPYAWFGRRERDMHDIWHVLTGYQANDPLGELCLVAFSYAQTKGMGWGFIATMGVLHDIAKPHGRAVARAVLEGYRNGRDAEWLHTENIETLFAEPLDAARTRLKIGKPVAYQGLKAAIEAQADVQAALVAAE